MTKISSQKIKALLALNFFLQMSFSAVAEQLNCELFEGIDGLPRNKVAVFINDENLSSELVKVLGIRFEKQEIDIGGGEPFIDKMDFYAACETTVRSGVTEYGVDVGKGYISGNCIRNGEIENNPYEPLKLRQKLEKASVLYGREDRVWHISHQLAWLDHDNEGLVGLSVVVDTNGKYVCD
jgi:hypothetical protein